MRKKKGGNPRENRPDFFENPGGLKNSELLNLLSEINGKYFKRGEISSESGEIFFKG